MSYIEKRSILTQLKNDYETVDVFLDKLIQKCIHSNSKSPLCDKNDYELYGKDISPGLFFFTLNKY